MEGVSTSGDEIGELENASKLISDSLKIDEKPAGKLEAYVFRVCYGRHVKMRISTILTRTTASTAAQNEVYRYASRYSGSI